MMMSRRIVYTHKNNNHLCLCPLKRKSTQLQKNNLFFLKLSFSIKWDFYTFWNEGPTGLYINASYRFQNKSGIHLFRNCQALLELHNSGHVRYNAYSQENGILPLAAYSITLLPDFHPFGFHTILLTISNYIPVRAKGNKFPPHPAIRYHPLDTSINWQQLNHRSQQRLLTDKCTTLENLGPSL